MHHYVNAITNTKGDALIGFFVRCVDATTGLSASLYADLSLTPILSVSGVANAAQVDKDGNASFYITAGTYHLDIYATDSTTFVRRIQNLPMIEEVNTRPFVTPQSYGAKGDNATNDNPAYVSALAGLAASELSGLGYGVGTATLSVPKAAAQYYMGTTPIDLTTTTVIQGESVGDAGGFASAQRWGANSHGYRVQYFGTSGDTTAGGTNTGGSGSIFCGLSLSGAYNGTTAPEGEYHGFFLRGRASIRDVNVWDFQGDGIHIHADSSQPEGGNANNWEVNKAFIQNVRNGLYTSGNDANAGLSYQVSIGSARQWGIRDEAGIPSVHIGPSTQLCGFSTNDGTTGKPVSVVTQGGQRYAVKVGQEVGASTNAPNGLSGIGTGDNTWWYWYAAGGVNANHPAWFSGIAVRAGGPYYMPNGGVIVSGYAEGGQPPCQFGGGVLRIGGTWDSRVIGGGFIYANSNQVQINDLHVVAGGIQFDDDQSGTLTVGRYSSGLHTAFIKCSTAASDLAIRSPGNTGGISVADASITVTAPFGYGAGVGGAVTQITSRTTGVTLNKICGQITLFSAAGTATWQTFTVTNSTVAATDTIRVVQASGTDLNQIHVTNVAAGSFKISFATTGGTTIEQPVFNFTVTKSVIS